MKGRTSNFLSLITTGLRGLLSRRLLTVGSILLTAISIGAAVVGPMYQSGAAASYLVTKLRSEPNYVLGLQYDYNPMKRGHLTALQSAKEASAGVLNKQFGTASLELWSSRLPGLGGQARLASSPGQCDHVTLVGRCPTKVGEALILRQDAAYAHVKVGQTITVAGAPPLRIVGTYSTRSQDENYWFNLQNLASVPPQPIGADGFTPFYPGPLLVTPTTFDKLKIQNWYVRAARRLIVTPATSLADLQQATRAVAAINRHQDATGLERLVPGSFTPEFGNALVAVSHEIQLRRSTARSTVTPAVVSVILVALVLLLRLLSAAMDLRRSELALASLRGVSRRQMWLLGLMEPVLMLVIATPLGIVGGYLAARALARTWLIDNLPFPLGLASVVAVLIVVVVTLVVSALVVRESVSEPLSVQIAGIRRPGRSGRWAVLLRLVLIAAAGTVLVATLAASKKSSPDATDLLLPILLAVAAGLITTLGAQYAARWWAALSARRRGIFSYLASRTIARRREGTLVILPLTAALAISVFAAGVYTAAADWRGSDAATIVGAQTSYSTALDLNQAVALTHTIDPAGRWLMAVGAQYESASEILIMDTPRLARVGLWPGSWTSGLTASDIQRDLSPRRPAVTLTGSRLSLTIDNHVSGDYDTLTADLTLGRSDGRDVDVFVGPFSQGVSTHTVTLPGCKPGCQVAQMSFGGPASLTEEMKGTATVTGFAVDGSPVAGALDQSWRVAVPLLNTPAAVSRTPSLAGGKLTVSFASSSAQSFAAITPGDVPLVRPVVMGRIAQPDVDRRTGDTLTLNTTAFVPLNVHSVATAESMPILGPHGMLIDYTMLTRDVGVDDASTFVNILARSDTPASIVAALGDHGISQATTLSQTRSLLDEEAFALALNLYLVVTIIVILLALAGLGANLAVQMPARRRDAAALRVVGLRRRSIISAVITEFAVVLGAAALAGIAAGSLAQYVVVRTVTLGYADTMHTPRLLASLNVTTVLELLVVVTVALLAISIAVAALTVRGARTSSLRENAR